MATKTTDKTAASDPLFDVLIAEDNEGKPVPETDIVALAKTPEVAKIKFGEVTHKIALFPGQVDMETWLADDVYRRDFYLKRGIRDYEAGEDPETTLERAHAQDEITRDMARWRLRGQLFLTALARRDGAPLTSLPELRAGADIETLMEPANFNLWGRRVIEACCNRIDAFFTS